MFFSPCSQCYFHEVNGVFLLFLSRSTAASSYASGAILESTGSWNAVLIITAGVYGLGAATWIAFSTGERIFD